MAPEQIRGGELDARTDVYALGGVAFATITGQPPFGRVEGDVAKLYAHLNDPPPRASDRVPGLPPTIDAVLQRAMAKKPDERYPSAGEFSRALEAAVGEAPVEPKMPAAVLEPTEEIPRERTAPTRVERTDGRRRALGALAGLAVVALVVGTVALLAGGDDPANDDASGDGGQTGGAPVVGEPVDAGVFTLGVAAKEGLVLVADRDGNELAIIDEEAQEPLDPVEVGEEPESVFAGEPIVWVTNAGDGTVWRFDFADGSLVRNAEAAEITLPETPQDVAVADQAAWVTDARGTVTRIEPSSGEVGAVIPVGTEPYGVDVDPGNSDLVFVVNRRSDNVSVIDRVTQEDVFDGRVVETVPVGQRPKAVVVAFGAAWVTNTDEGSVSRIAASDPFRETKVRNVCGQPRDIAAGFGAIWVSCAEGKVARIEPGSDDASEVELGDIPGEPEGIAAGNDAVWVAMGDAGTVVPITPTDE